MRTLPYLLLHAGCLLVLWAGISWIAVAAALLLYGLRMFAITAFYHRYFSHRAFKTSRFCQFLFAVAGNTAMQRGPLWWAAHHRHHHHHSDGEQDRHSPVHGGFWWSHIGWLVDQRNFPTDYGKVKDFAKYPELVFLNRYDYLVPLLYGATLAGFGFLLEKFAPGLGTNAAQLFVWGFFVSTVLLLHGTLSVNSLAHVWGSRRFPTSDDSRNNWLLALLTLGEGWHNNHHRYQHSARQGFYWYEIDISYYLLKLFASAGIITNLHPVPEKIYNEADSSRSVTRNTKTSLTDETL